MNKNELFELMDKDFFVVDCENFIFFPRKVKVIGVAELSYNSEIRFTINQKKIDGEWKEVYKEELLTFKEAEKCAKELNEIQKNKEQAEFWNSIENQYNLAILKYLDFKEEQ